MGRFSLRAPFLLTFGGFLFMLVGLVLYLNFEVRYRLTACCVDDERFRKLNRRLGENRFGEAKEGGLIGIANRHSVLIYCISLAEDIGAVYQLNSETHEAATLLATFILFPVAEFLTRHGTSREGMDHSAEQAGRCFHPRGDEQQREPLNFLVLHGAVVDGTREVTEDVVGVVATATLIK